MPAQGTIAGVPLVRVVWTRHERAARVRSDAEVSSEGE